MRSEDTASPTKLTRTRKYFPCTRTTTRCEILLCGFRVATNLKDRERKEAHEGISIESGTEIADALKGFIAVVSQRSISRKDEIQKYGRVQRPTLPKLDFM